MGGVFSKTEDVKVYDSPKKIYSDASGILDFDDDFLENIDPRSPSTNISRTPIDDKLLRCIQREQITMKYDLASEFETPFKTVSQNGQLKEKLLKTLGYDLNDPRSPSQMINRTPIILNAQKHIPIDNNKDNEFEVNIEKETSAPSVEFQEIGNESSFELRLSSMCDDFVKDLSTVGTSVVEDVNDGEVQVDEECDSKKEYLETNFDVIAETEQIDGTPTIDPRSPSLGIERTPLVFKEDIDAKFEGQIVVDREITEMISDVISDIKTYSKKKKDEKVALGNDKVVYEETESVKFSTPKKQNVFGSGNLNRTPLGCLGNKKSAFQSFADSNQVHGNLKKTKIPLGPSKLYHNDENTPEKGGSQFHKFANNYGSGSAVLLRGKSKIPIGPKRLSLNSNKL